MTVPSPQQQKTLEGGTTFTNIVELCSQNVVGGGGRVSAQAAVDMAAAFAGCRKALVSTGWTQFPTS